MKERIQKVLAGLGVASRRSVEEMIRQGRVAVNGRVITTLPILIDPAKDKVHVDDEPIRMAARTEGKRLYILMNKPKDVYTTNVAQGEQQLAIDLLPPGLPGRVYPVGRLEAETKGLLLLTNDGELTNELTHPRYGVPKTYRAIVDGFVKGETLLDLEKGVWLADPHTGKGFKTGRTHLKIVKRLRDKSVLEITTRQSRNREIRRMLAKIGHKVRDLTRVRIGDLTLQGLAPGQCRPLTPREVKQLRQLAEPKRGIKEPSPRSHEEHE